MDVTLSPLSLHGHHPVPTCTDPPVPVVTTHTRSPPHPMVTPYTVVSLAMHTPSPVCTPCPCEDSICVSFTLSPYTQMSLYPHGHPTHMDTTSFPRSPHIHRYHFVPRVPAGPHFIPRVLAHPWVLPGSHGHHMHMDSHGQDRHKNITLSPGSWHSPGQGHHPVPMATTFTWVSCCPHGHYLNTDTTSPPGSLHSHGHHFVPVVVT